MPRWGSYARPASARTISASEDAVESKLGHRYERVEELEDDPEAPRVAYRTRTSLGESEDRLIGSLTYLPAVVAAGTVVASAGVVAAAVTGTAIAGALIGTGCEYPSASSRSRPLSAAR